MATDVSTSVVTSLSLATLTAVVASVSCCRMHRHCNGEGTCVGIDDGWCSFRNVVSPLGYRLYNMSADTALLETLERGVCSWGERQSAIDGKVTCVRQRSFPDALNTEIMQADASPYHRKYCGKWMDCVRGVAMKYWSLYDTEDVANDVTHAVYSKYHVRNGVSNVGMFHGACVRMELTLSANAASQLAYVYLTSQLLPPQNERDVLSNVGMLSSYFCDAPAVIGVTFHTNPGQGLRLNVSEGTYRSTTEMIRTMYANGASRQAMRDAETMAESIRSSRSWTVSKDDVNAFIEGSVIGSSMEGRTTGILPHGLELRRLAQFIDAMRIHGVEFAHSYVLGLAALCVETVRSLISGDDAVLGAAHPLNDDGLDMFNEEAHTASLGRLPTRRDGERVEAITPQRMLEASSTGLSTLRRHGRVTRARSNRVIERCNRATAMLFADELDKDAFDILVPRPLYDKIQTMDAQIREAVRTSMLGRFVSPLLSNPGRAADLVNASRLRVAGAPRDSWGGRGAAAVAPMFDSDDGAYVMLLKQAKGVYEDRLGLVVAGASMEQFPPLMSPLARNGYMLYLHGVAMLLPGILVPPFASARYDDDSLYSRIGYVIAHEYAHITAGVPWNQFEAMQYLEELGYPPSEHYEAIADITAVSALLDAGLVDRDTLCASVSQLWCASSSLLNSIFVEKIPDGSGSHPPANSRGDRLCAFIYKNYE